MLNELRFAFRMLLKNPVFTIVAVATMALAIGANTAVFSLINALLIRPLPYQEPQNLVLLWEKFPAQGLERIPCSAPEYMDYTKEVQSMDVAAFDYIDLNLTAGDMPERISGAVVTPSLFPVLGIQPIQGRVFSSTEFGEGNDGVVVISERLWQRRFSRDGGLVGKQIPLNGRSFTVVGIMPSKFEFPLPLFNVQGGTFGHQVDIWKPIAFSKDDLESRSSRSFGLVGRLHNGMTLAKAQAEVDTIVAGWRERFPDNYDKSSPFGATLYDFHDQVVGGMRGALLILLGAVAVVLLIACANLTTMLLARAGAREREFAIRVALGAGPGRLYSTDVIRKCPGGIVRRTDWYVARNLGPRFSADNWFTNCSSPGRSESGLASPGHYVVGFHRHWDFVRSYSGAFQCETAIDGSIEGGRSGFHRGYSSQSGSQCVGRGGSGARVGLAGWRKSAAQEFCSVAKC